MQSNSHSAAPIVLPALFTVQRCTLGTLHVSTQARQIDRFREK